MLSALRISQRAKFLSLIRLYDGKKLKRECREGFHYSSVRWRFLGLPTGVVSGRHEGLTQRLPAFIGRETYAARIAGLSPHQTGHDVIERGTEAVEGVTYRQDEIGGNRLGGKSDALMPGLRISIIDNAVEVALGVCGEPVMRLVNVAVGPIDL